MVFHYRLRNLLEFELDERLTSVVQRKYTNLASMKASIESNPCASNEFLPNQLDGGDCLSQTFFNL